MFWQRSLGLEQGLFTSVRPSPEKTDDCCCFSAQDNAGRRGAERLLASPEIPLLLWKPVCAILAQWDPDLGVFPELEPRACSWEELVGGRLVPEAKLPSPSPSSERQKGKRHLFFLQQKGIALMDSIIVRQPCTWMGTDLTLNVSPKSGNSR